jgi:hypothetical protein
VHLLHEVSLVLPHVCGEPTAVTIFIIQE